MASDRKKNTQDVKKFIENMSKEALAAALSKKKECQAKALLIVEKSIEPNIEKIWLLDNLKHINQSHFQDIVEERAISKFCGYPLCDAPLVDVPRKMYKISTRVNKVYDITDRKNYCSNTCYKAGTYLKDQLYTSPLWLRVCEKPVAYEVLSSSKKGEASGVGTEIYIGDTRRVRLDTPVVCEEKESFEICTVDKFRHQPAHLLESDINVTNADSERPDPLPPEKMNSMSELISQSSSAKLTEEKTEPSICGSSRDISVDPDCHNINDCLNKVDIQQKTVDSKLQCKQKKEKKRYDYKPYVCLVDNIEQVIVSWFTLETMLHILGQHKLRELLKVRGIVEEVQSVKRDIVFEKKCREIYKRINILEPKGKEYPTKPDYDSLCKDTIDMQLKVESFWKGNKQVTFSVDEENDNSCPDQEETDRVLPLIDHYSISETRFKIFMGRLNKVLPDILKALDLTDFELGCDIQKLATTFHLTAGNIILRPPEWALVIVILVKLLTLNNELLDFAYSREVTQKRLMSYLLTYDLDGGYLDRFTSYLMDVDRLVETLDIK